MTCGAVNELVPEWTCELAVGHDGFHRGARAGWEPQASDEVALVDRLLADVLELRRRWDAYKVGWMLLVAAEGGPHDPLRALNLQLTMEVSG